MERQIETSKTLVRKGFGYSVSDFLPNDKTNKKNHATDRTESDAKFNLAPSLTSDKSPYFAINEQGGGEFIVDEIYEVEEYSLLRRSWKSVGLFSMHGVAAGKSNRIVLENRSSNSLIWELSDDFKDSSWQYTSKKVFTTIDSLWGQKSWNSCLRRRKWIKKSQRNKKMSRDSSYRSTRSNSVCSNPIVTYDGPCVVDEDKELDMCIVTLSNTLDKVDGLSKQINEEVRLIPPFPLLIFLSFFGLRNSI